MSSIGAPSPQPTDYLVQQGGKAAIWQSGMAIAVDAPKNRVFFVTRFVVQDHYTADMSDIYFPQ
jgi:hypothetical protein